MKSRIEITGQTAGNFRLLRKIKNYEKVNQFFNDYTLYYNSIGEARADLKQACKRLTEDEPEFAKEDGIYFYNDTLFYDASKAKLIY